VCICILPKTANGGKRRSLRLPQMQLTPLKTFGICSANPKKKGRFRARFPKIVRIWLIFTTKLEPISSKMPKVQPRRLARQAVLRPARKTLCIFF
jgi:hypothetical protein